MKSETLEDLLHAQLRQLYDEEQRLVDALPKMARHAASERLREAFRQHLEQTRGHVERLKQCFRDVDRKPESETAAGMKGLITEGEQLISEIGQSPLCDAALIGAARRVEHYEIAAYSAVIPIAQLLGYETTARLLEQTLCEEQATDVRLTQIADSTTNQEALQLGAHQRA